MRKQMVINMTQNTGKRLLTGIFVLLSVLLTCFVFGNSLLDGKSSMAESDVIVDAARPIVDPERDVSYEDFSSFIRKLAHFAEFCALGFAYGGTMRMLSARTPSVHWRYHIGSVFFCILLAAVADEYIQSFTDRSSMVSDVLLDFCGGIMGVGIVMVCFALAGWRSAKRNP